MSYSTFPLADDVIPIIANFREKGKSFEDYDSLSELRETYRENCLAAAIEPPSQVISHDFLCSTADGSEIALRQYRKADSVDEVLPCVIFIHGGGWVIGDLESHDGLCKYICSISDHSIISIDYRLAPENDFKTVLSDCEQGIKYILDNYKELKIDLSCLSLMGDSAGGYLAAYFSQRFQDIFNRKICAQVLLYPVVNLSPQFASYSEIKDGFALTGSTMSWFLEQCQLHKLSQSIDSYSLVNKLVDSDKTSEKPPVFLVTVGHDPLRDEGLYLSRVLSENGFNLEHHHLPGHMHGIFTLFGIIPTAQKLLNRVALFLKSTSSIK